MCSVTTMSIIRILLTMLEQLLSANFQVYIETELLQKLDKRT